MATTISPPLYDRISRKNPTYRAFDVTILILLISLLLYRIFSLNSYGLPGFLALNCELWFTFFWIITVNCKWNSVEYKTYPDRLSQRVEDLPPVDMLVTTTDPILESPIITVNTVLSLLAVDYPTDKLACYVSDDGCSLITFYSLVEAAKFAKHWVPFCKKYNIHVRAPFRYFSGEYCISSTADNSLEFHREWKKMKDEYEELSRIINDAAHNSVLMDTCGDLAVFSDVERRNHPTIIKLISENKDPIDGLPHLIYVSREKRPKHPHHYKAGAMNVLTRVSGLITNAPFILNVDCDMFANNSQVVAHAMCLLLGSRHERDSGFVQFPQVFYDGLKDDPFGNQMVVLHEYVARGVAGIQGPFYEGTGCFHRRKVIYGLCPDGIEGKNLNPINAAGHLADKEQLKIFGNSEEFINSAAYALQEKTNDPKNFLKLDEAALQVAGCGYEYGTVWGTEVGWQYGSATEDVLTGLSIHGRGWRSVLCTPDLPCFLGCAPPAGPTSMTQHKRWTTGFLEILISRKNPIFFMPTLPFRQCLAYIWLLVWGLCSIPELCYAVLPAYCIITNTRFLPQVGEPAIGIHVTLVAIYIVYSLMEYLEMGQSCRAWWNNQRMRRINAMNAWLFSVPAIILKILGISVTVFELTQKEQSLSGDNNGDAGRFTFDGSPYFLPGTTLVLLQFTALIKVLFGSWLPVINDGPGSGIGETVCSVLVLLCYWPFVKGLTAKGKFGIPLPTILKAALLVLFFVCSRAIGR